MITLPFLLLTTLAATDPRLEVNGLPWLAENHGELIRLPRRLEKELPPAVWNLGLSPSGGRIRFRTDSTRLAIKLSYPSPPNMANMHAFGQTGVDIYLDGVYRSTAIAPKDAAPDKPVDFTFFEGLPKQMRDVTLYLPLYKGVKVLGIDFDEGAAIQKPRRFAVAKPIVFYGTSITQGGCASRSGLSYQAILGRQLNVDFVNLGFSGNGKGEPVTAAMTAEIDASMFVLDYSQNNRTVESLREVYAPFLATVRGKHPRTPIVAITPIASSRDGQNLRDMREHIRTVVNAQIAAGDKLLTLVEGESLLGPGRLDGLVDGTHPNDLGFQWMADDLAPTVARLLALPPPVLVNDRAITVTSSAAVEAKRAEVVRYIWGAAGLPRRSRPASIQTNAPSPVPDLPNLKRVDTFTIKMDAGQENTTHHFIPAARANGKLMVLQHGHACTFDDARDPRGAGMADTLATLLDAGYGVLAAYMPHMRPGECRTLAHGKLFDLPVAAGTSALKFFLEPVAVSLNELRSKYKEVHMAGLSGGGWTTTLYAAVDPSIRTSYPVAGTIPLHLRIGGSVGDLEQYLDEFYRMAGYPDLYMLGSWGRQQTQILNRRDDCCFGEAQHNAARIGAPYADAMREYAARVQKALGAQGSFELVIDESAPRHMISPEAAKRIAAGPR
ncbi:MAG: SGNH/GDSL hydrolase family protein [Bryobacterales bacterium]|nr:SGNH/GDSL hydrolase family protein [Bryobacterales bacterium]